MSPVARRWARVWHIWLLLTAGSFAVLEARALTAHGDTASLSAHLRRTLAIHPRRRGCAAGRLLLVAVLGWLTVHLCAGVWPRDGAFPPPP